MAEFDKLIGSNGVPTHWYNIVPDMPKPPAVPLHPATHQPVTPQDLAPMFQIGRASCRERV